MKSFVLSLLACAIGFATTASGAEVNSTAASAAVKGWLQLEHSPLGAKLGDQVDRVETHKDRSGAPLYHVVYLKPSGFVIVSGEDQMEPIIAFVNQGSFDPSEKNPLGAMISRDLPNRVAHARKHANSSGGLKNHAKWQKLQAAASDSSGGVQSKSVSSGSISDMRVAPFVNTLWNQGDLDNYVTDLISLNNQVAVRTHFDSNLVGDTAAASVICPTNVVTMLVNPGSPATRSFSFSTATVDVVNGPDSTVTNVISVAIPIQITIINTYGETLFSQSFTTNVTFTNIVSGGSQGAIIQSQIPFTIPLTEVVNDALGCYNYFTPSHSAGDPENVVCGCVATALAQLMYYYQYPSTGVGTTSFAISFDGYPMQWPWPLRGGDGHGGPYDWASMPLAPVNSSTPGQRMAVGALTYDAGIAVHMQYSDMSAGSAAYMSDAKTALVSTFKYGNAILTEANTINVGYDLVDMINPNLDARQPVVFGIQNSVGGHCIVCDGYGYSTETLYHHLNMGWGGIDNAWYHFPLIDLTDTAPYYNFDACLYNVYTNGSGEIISGRVLDAGGNPLSNANVTAATAKGALFAATTDKNGIYALAGLPSASSFNVTVTDNGYYPATGSFSTGLSSDNGTNCGNHWGVNFTLTSAQGPPVFNVQPANQTTTIGSSTAFYAYATGQLPLTYQWQYQPVGSPAWINLNDDGITSGSQTATLTIYPAALTMNGESFQCVASNSIGVTTSTPATLTVNGVIPTFIIQPQSQTVVAGSNANFSAFATGTSPINYQWQYQPSGSLNWVNVNDDGTNSGSQTTALAVNPVDLSMNGKPLQCVVSNLWGSTTSAPISLFVSVDNSTPVALGTLAGLAGTYGGTDGLGTNALFYNPHGIAVDSHTNVYVADMNNHVIRMISPTGSGWLVSTIAGLAGTFGTNDGANGNARFHSPYGVAVDGNGNLFVADTSNHTIRKLTPTGTNWVITTISGLAGTPGTNDGSSSARYRLPMGIALDKVNNVYVADEGNHSIRKLAFNGAVWTASTISGGSSGSTDGTNANAKFGSLYGLTVNASGTVFAADQYYNTIRQVTPSGANWVATTIAGQSGASGSADGIGSSARFKAPTGIAAGVDGNLYVADNGNNTIRRLSPSGTSWTVFTVAGLAGSSGSVDGTGSGIRLNGPFGIAMDSYTNLFVADANNDTIRGFVLTATPTPMLVHLLRQNSQSKFAVTWNAVAGQTYQVQYKTNLSQTVWSIYATVTASNWTGTASVPVGSEPQRFYRVVPTP